MNTYSIIRLRHFRVYAPEIPDALLEFSSVPSDCIPIQAMAISDGWRIGIPLDPSPEPPLVPVPQSFEAYLSTIPDHEQKHLVRWHTYGATIQELIARIPSFDEILLVSDGGAIDVYGSYGWILSDCGGNRLAHGTGPAYGHDPNSYRAEISGC